LKVIWELSIIKLKQNNRSCDTYSWAYSCTGFPPDYQKTGTK